MEAKLWFFLQCFFNFLKVFKMKKLLSLLLLASISGVSSANCEWGNCTRAERLQEYQQNQLNQLNSINNSLLQIQQQQRQQQQFQQPQQIRPNDPSTWGGQPSYQQQSRCWVTSFGKVECMWAWIHKANPHFCKSDITFCKSKISLLVRQQCIKLSFINLYLLSYLFLGVLQRGITPHWLKMIFIEIKHIATVMRVQLTLIWGNHTTQS